MRQTIDELQRRIATLQSHLERLEAVEGVRHTLSKYPFMLDSGRWDELADLFAEDAILEIVGATTVNVDGTNRETSGAYHGRAAIRAFYSSLSPKAAPRFKHDMTNIHIEIDSQGNEASAESYFISPGPQKEIGTSGGGLYQDRLRRESDGCWRIVHKRILTTLAMWAERAETTA
jgi:hypothetical protein